MSSQLTLTIPVENGKLKPSEQQHFAMESFLHRRDGKAVTVKFSVPTNTRTLSQNSLYWKILSVIGRETGNEAEDLHQIFKDRFLPRRFVRLGEKEIELRKTTTELTTGEFSELIEKIRVFCGSELGINLPLE